MTYLKVVSQWEIQYEIKVWSTIYIPNYEQVDLLHYKNGYTLFQSKQNWD